MFEIKQPVKLGPTFYIHTMTICCHNESHANSC